MEFTKANIEALSLPHGKADAIFFADDLPGFGIRLRAGGGRAWVVQYRAAGRQRRVTIGDARKVNLKAARAEAEKRFAEITLGRDPQAEKEEAKSRAAVRVGPLVTKYLELKRPIVRRNTYVADERYLTSYWKPLHSLSVDAATRRVIASELNDIAAERGVTAAARARQSLSAFFTWLIREGMADANPVVGTNDPARGVEARDRVLSDAELRIVWKASGEGHFGAIVRLLALTGCRRDEIGGLRWSEIDLDKGLLTIPGSRTKNHHAHLLTLPEAALSILRNIRRRDDREYLFGARGGPFSRWAWEKLAIDKRIAEAGGSVAPWRIHDIRRTVATGMAEIGVAPHIIEAVLNHRSGHKAGVAGVYNRANYEREIAAALDRWAAHVLAIVEGGNVVPLSKRA
jgi:integrase